jgi:benzoyl-CoA reductase subunit BamC
MCVQVCEPGCLTYEERDVEKEPEVDKKTEMEQSLDALIRKHGLKTVRDTISKMSK